MATVNYSLDIDRVDNDVRVYMEGITEETVIRLAKEVKSEIVSLIRQRSIGSGDTLADSVYGVPFHDIDGTSATIRSDLPESIWFEEGTGLHGPRNQYIFARQSKYMWFKPTGKSYTVRAQKVEGQKARHPFRDGLNKVVGRGGALRRLA